MKKRKRQLMTNDSLPAEFHQGFEVMVRQHTSYLKGVAFSILRNREDVDEVLQDSFVKAYISLLGFSDEGRANLQARSWLSTIVRNTACNIYRKSIGKFPLTTLVKLTASLLQAIPMTGPSQQ